MNHYLVNILLTYSILLPAIAGIIRYKLVLKDFRPFFWLLWLGVINETVSVISIYSIRSNSVNSNIYVFLEFCFILLLYYRWRDSRPRNFIVLGVLGLLVWVSDNILMHHITENNSLFRMFYSFVIVFLSIDMVNRILVLDTSPVYKNPMFLIAFAFVFYYAFKGYVESFNVLHIGLSRETLNSLWKILYFVNVVANLIFTTAVLCMPKKQKFIMPY
jgi:hypothetical protein